MMYFIKGLKGYWLISLLVVMGCCHAAMAQTSGTNYIRTRVPREPVADTSALDTIPVQRQYVMVTYSDGLGRPLQNIRVQGSAGLNDIIMPYVYDNMGRLAKTFIPYAYQGTTIGMAGTYHSAAASEVMSFYNPSSPGASKIPVDSAPFSQTVYEASPLSRVMEQGGLGTVFQPGSGHTVTASYQVNSLADNIPKYYVDQGVPADFSIYDGGVLSQTVVTDQNGHRQAVWKDLQGRIVTQTQLDAPTAYYSTDYIYNDLNQLINLVTPAAKKQFFNATGITISQTLDQQCYTYRYDSVGRVVEKKVPGKGWIYAVYNHRDLPVLAQDSNMRAKSQWLYMKYDAEGRLVQTGIYTNKTVTDRKALQFLCDSNFPVLWEMWQPGTGYTNNAFPQQSAVPGPAPLTVYTIYYYDDYSFAEAAAKPFQTNSYQTNPTMRTMGMLTGTSVYILGTSNQRLVTVNYYDNKNRLIQKVGDNHLGQVDIVNIQYNFVGDVTGSQRITTLVAGTSITVADRKVYDHMDRLLDIYESFQGSPEIDISHNEYNEADQEVSEGLHSVNYHGPGTLTYTGPGSIPATITENTALSSGKTDIAGYSVVLNPGFSFTASAGNTYSAAIGASFAQTQEFRYSIRGELTSINNGTLTNDGGITQSDPNALFGESLTYEGSSPLGATPRYDGNISGITWRNKIEQTGIAGVTTGAQGYAFTYDNVNRLTQTAYYTRPDSTFIENTAGALTENISGYDEMGNIDTLQRRDKTGSLLNNLVYTYQPLGNQLQSVSDAGSQHISGTFTYDGNGNMTTDSRKGITITYNYLDLPDTIKQGSNRLVFTYDADGNKLYKQLITSGIVISQRHYIGDVEVTATSSLTVDGKVESIAIENGRIVNAGAGGYQYEYYLRDHLGTNRVSFRPNTDGSLNLTSVQNYYPFGGDMGDATMNYSASPQNLYKYEWKEKQLELNLNTYDFGARHYDPVLARWTAIDPLAEESGELSPYNYVKNNPLNMRDPDGMDPTSLKCYNWGSSGYGSGSLGIAGDIGGNVLTAGIAAYQAWNAFSFTNPQTTHWLENLPQVQQNQTQVNTNPPDGAPIPLKTSNSDNSQGRATIKILVVDSHSIQDVGHTAIQLNSNYVFGYYPTGGSDGTTGSGDLMLSKGKPDIEARDEFDKKGYLSRGYTEYTLNVTSKQLSSVRNYLSNIMSNPGNYNLFLNNCTSVVISALENAGVPIRTSYGPIDPVMTLPVDFGRMLSNPNFMPPGLVKGIQHFGGN